ncbi:UDP-N-acetylmuramoyl-L-alanyl-D-glutamate--2,6-diaminopimelate ligase [Rhizomonospora bruguierae]|uniref:UDP-N-acetylmuramoyl-L-alanyl-D-glutamate--2, 6-diaminopimelate ligase n=1 Tax=Rhizomonospora bruguierae TaxID=1581705 RepID=UPI001BD0F0F1|nr:UDP-N-acetylmuramoyl-L-alanyl-D-glutamate--2,6-diaminopimelate ligase [Micromonospora sp. NBRC 107566]
MPGYPRPRTVAPRAVSDLAAQLNAAIGGAGEPAVRVGGVTHASDSVRPGDLYAALPGARRHGAEFVPAAAAAGAVAILTDADGAPAAVAAGLPALVAPDPRAVLGTVASAVYGEPTARLRVTGITGTAGKTSTAYLIESGLRAAGRVTGLIGTVETRIGEQTIDSVRTTPEATDLHALFAVALEWGVTDVAMEVSSHALVMGRVGGVRFTVGGYTNFGSDHLDFHGDAQAYFAAKARLFDGRCAAEVLNADDPALVPLRKPATVTYSAGGDRSATWRAEDVRDDGYAQRFTVLGPATVRLPGAVLLPGRHNVANAMLAIAVLVAGGIDPEVAVRGVAECPGVPGRLERVTAAGPVLGVVDFAHTPNAVEAALVALRALADSRDARLICVLGAGGDRDAAKRPLMGAAAANGADLVVVTDDNPRSEEPAAIRAAVAAGARSAGGAEVTEVDGRRAAIAAAVRAAAPGDVVALLGKGHERGQEVGGVVHPFDDRIELAAALAAAAAGAGEAADRAVGRERPA